MKQKIENDFFTEEELKILNFSAEELDLILDADATAKTAEMIPEDISKIIKRIDKEFPNDVNGTFEKLAQLCKSDPKFITQLMAITEVCSEVKPEVKAEASVQKVTKKDISSEKKNETLNEIKKVLKKK